MFLSPKESNGRIMVFNFHCLVYVWIHVCTRVYIYMPLDEHTFSGSIGLSFRGLYQYLLNPSQGVFGCVGCM